MTCGVAEGSYGHVRWAVRPGGTIAAQEDWHLLDENLQVRFETLFLWLANEQTIRNADRWSAVKGTDGLWRLAAGNAVIVACQREKETILLSVLHPAPRNISVEEINHAQIIRAEDIGGHV